jgi:Fe2+ transport system protein FeoA
MRNLHQLKPGESAIIEDFSDKLMASRLMSMGVIPGAEITLIRHSYSKASCIVQLQALTLALRKSEASGILISS